jgi:hypothetical protein
MEPASDDPDAQVSRACLAVGALLESHAQKVGAAALRERAHLQPAIRAALARGLGDRVIPVERRFRMPGWDAGGSLGGVDVLVRALLSDDHSLFVELKWCHSRAELGWTLWDTYKMAAATYLPGVEAAYVVAGAPEVFWLDETHCAPLFASDEWGSRDLFARFAINWEELLSGGTARPSWVPARIATDLVADVRLQEIGWRLRAIRVAPVGQERLLFRDGWPEEQRPSG